MEPNKPDPLNKACHESYKRVYSPPIPGTPNALYLSTLIKQACLGGSTESASASHCHKIAQLVHLHRLNGTKLRLV
jgi:hypothetical protein